MAQKTNGKGAEFVFLPLGGVGEIGMNLYLYGYGRDGVREWLIVDMGVTFGSDYEPGVDLILPDIRFIEEVRQNIAGLLLTHAHEDHFGAVVDLWPSLGGIPVYATPFTAEMLKSKLAEIGLVNGFPLEIIPLGARRTIGPFDVELVSMSHSIPEPSAVIIRTPLGAALHTGDWKLDENPLTSAPTDIERLKTLGWQIAYTENVQAADMVEALRDYARQGYKVVVGHTGRFLSAAQRVGPEFPNTLFLVGSGSAGAGENVTSVDYDNAQLGYLMGVMAARMSKTGKVGSVNGLEGLPNVVAQVGGFRSARLRAVEEGSRPG